MGMRPGANMCLIHYHIHLFVKIPAVFTMKAVNTERTVMAGNDNPILGAQFFILLGGEILAMRTNGAIDEKYSIFGVLTIESGGEEFLNLLNVMGDELMRNGDHKPLTVAQNW